MARSLYIEIAGISFAVSGADKKLLVSPPADQAYPPFIEPAVAGAPDIHVTVFPESALVPGRDDTLQLCDGGGVWNLFRHADGYRLIHNPIESKPPLWTIYADDAFTVLSAYCHPSICSRVNGRYQVPCPISYPLDQIILLHHLARKEGLILHSAGLAYAGQGILFPGPSGAGKSSVASLLKPDGGFSVISDDRMVVRKQDELLITYGTPWPGETKIAVNRNVALDTIFFLTQARSNRVRPLESAQALKRLLPIASIPWYDQAVLPGVLDFCGYLVENTAVFELQFKLDGQLMGTLADCLAGAP